MSRRVEYVHYTNRPPGTLVESTDYLFKTIKPMGFWFSVGAEAWPNVVLGMPEENHPRFGLTHAFDVRLKRGAAILRLRSGAAIRRFTDEYCLDAHGTPAVQIDWRRVSETYDGIIISAYRRVRFDHPEFLRLVWLTSWDCASGCVWRPRAIAALTPRPKRCA